MSYMFYRLIADLKKRIYYQKCHDPDCKAANFKSDGRLCVVCCFTMFVYTTELVNSTTQGMQHIL